MLAAVVVIGGSEAGCDAPTCESTCDRIYNTCGFDYEGDGLSTSAHEANCVDSCRNTLGSRDQESQTLTWMSCVQSFQCEGLDDPNGYAIREACPPDEYYLGQYAKPVYQDKK